ncbi:MAG: NAD(P)-dependent alcohol dehydrogenase [Acidimicrobiia bacterium]|nr:NAD(P)-dependent alcohol dehydrogenase [Acidimicrobiia bacterium]
MSTQEVGPDGTMMNTGDGMPKPSAETEPKMMKAIVQDRYGLPDVLALRDVEVPVPTDDQLLIRVIAASLNIYDWHMITATPFLVRAIAGFAKPKHPIPGADVAGVVEQVGANITRFKVGDEVFGDIGFGAFAQHAVAREKSLAHKPADTTFEQAASVALAGITALQGLRDVGGLEAGQKVLVNGASGGVGTFAVQIAKALGAEVTAVCSTTKVDMVRSIGADKVIDYTKDDYVESERGYDLLFDNVGNRPWSATSRVLSPGGINVTITGPKHAVMGPMREQLFRKVVAGFGKKRFAFFTAHVNPEDLEVLADFLETDAIVPVIEATYDLEHLPDALRYLGDGHALGKLVVSV